MNNKILRLMGEYSISATTKLFALFTKKNSIQKRMNLKKITLME